MAKQKRRDTAPELLLRRALHKEGLRYRVDFAPDVTSRARADIVFSASKVAVFVDGCFWHFCPEHGQVPTNNAAWWRAKLEANRARDEETTARLQRLGWTVVRAWEHDSIEATVAQIRMLVLRRSDARSGRNNIASRV